MIAENAHHFIDQAVVLGNKTLRGRLVIPSGIRCTRASTIALCFRDVPEVGVVTTKSISLAPRAGYVEPIYARYAEDSYINAVGLSNPGADSFRRELQGISVPEDKFLLVSIFGGNAAQFVETALALKDVADGFELNMSCPHAEGYGVEIGQKKELVAEITAAVSVATGLPVIVKLSAVVGDVGLTAKAAIEAGAAGITVSNTIGPATVNLHGLPILSNRVGGLSGASIRPLALRAVRRVREAIGNGPIIIGMGGIGAPEDILDFHAAGADLFGVGSAVTGMDSAEMRQYFSRLMAGTRDTTRASLEPHPPIDMAYTAATVVSRHHYHPELFKLALDHLPVRGEPGELAGRYVFLTQPGVGEKPFAIFCAQERSIVIRVAGRFTRYLATLEPGARLYVRGPYGRRFPRVEGREVVLVGGGTGIASLLEIAHWLAGKNRLTFLLGGRSARDLFDLDRFSHLGALKVSTNDGSQGHAGFVSELLANWMAGNPSRPFYVFCGPEPMVEACFKLVSGKAPAEDVWAAIEYMTSCGVGICGKCASPAGLLTCIDGPFLSREGFEPVGRPAV